MKIQIEQKLSPFSHTPGTYFVLPGSSLQVQIFPTRLIFQDLQDEKNASFVVDLQINGPHKDFTAELHLSEGYVKVFTEAQNGYIRYYLQAVKEGVQIYLEKASCGLVCFCMGKEIKIHAKEQKLLPIPFSFYEASQIERISFGIHKKLDWDLVKKRRLLDEILPVWFHLSQLVPKQTPANSEDGTLFLLERCKNLMQEKSRVGLYSAWMDLFDSGFEGVLSPRSEDPYFWGTTPKANSRFSPLLLLESAYFAIRDLFFQEQGNTYSFLPCLPPEFHSGRMVRVRTKDGDQVDFEWSKKTLQKIVWRSAISREIQLNLSNDLSSFRIRKSLKDRGRKMEKTDPVFLEERGVLFLDRFQK